MPFKHFSLIQLKKWGGEKNMCIKIGSVLCADVSVWAPHCSALELGAFFCLNDS